MINSIKTEIAASLKTAFPTITKRYMYDNIPQNFVSPAFYLTVISHEYGKRINNKFNSVVRFDLAYFSNSIIEEINSDCLSKQIGILRMFTELSTIRPLNVEARITDNVLHVIFDIRYTEISAPTYETMETMTQTTEL